MRYQKEFLDECVLRGVLPCTKCKKEKPLSEMAKSVRVLRGYANICKSCKYGIARKYRHRYKQVRLENLPSYDQLISNIPEVCEICRKAPQVRRLALDHCHLTNTLRGWICYKCNLGLGYFDDNTDVLQEAINYLRK